MKKNVIFQILISILFLTSCDRTYTDGLEVINETKDSLYYSIFTYKDDLSINYNIAYNCFDVGKNNQIKYKYVIDFDNNDNSIKPNESDKPYSFKITWKDFAKKHNGLTFTFYKRETLEKMKYDAIITEDKIYKRIDLTYEQLEKINYIVRLK
jgi:hypothetical protein